jgi:hypothetical protein
MADESKIKGGDAESTTSENPAIDELVYESNPKHSEPWQTGKKGSLCEPEVRPLAAGLLRAGVIWKGKRYAVHMGRAYCAQEHSPNRWHGYPVGWVEVPSKLARQWIRSGALTNHDRKKYWEGH